MPRFTAITIGVAGGFLLLLPAVPQPGRAESPTWSPKPEPEAWAEIRRTLLKKGPPQGLTAGNWTFFRALDRPDLRVGEYLADRSRGKGLRADDVMFRAAVLLLRSDGDGEWQVREQRMRALCREGRLQILTPSGIWRDDPGSGDAEASQRLAWICTPPPTTASEGATP